MVLQAVRLDLPFQLLSQRKALVEKEPMDYQGKRLRVVELPFENGLAITAGIESPEPKRFFVMSDRASFFAPVPSARV